MTTVIISKPIFIRWLLPVLQEWVVIIALLVLGLWVDTWWIWPLVVIVLGTRQHALAILGHDAAHFLATRSRWLNDAAGQLLCFWPLGTGIDAYRTFHFSHHRNLGTDADPERIHLRGWSKKHFTQPKSRLRMGLYVLGDLLGLGIPEVVKAIKLVGKKGAADWLGPPLLQLGVFGPLLWLGYWQVLVVWYLALLTSFWACFRLRIWTEHVGTDDTYIVQANWWQRLLFCPRNTWYHYEHHANASVPFWDLPRVRRVMGHSATTLGDLFERYEKGSL